MTDVISLNGRVIDLSDRLTKTTAVAASPAAAAETVIGTLTLPSGLTIVEGIYLWGWAAWTVGTSGDGVNLKIRQTGTSGTTIAATGLVTSTAANLDSRSVAGFDASPVGAQVYVLTMTVHSGAAESTVSAVSLIALAV